MAINEINNGREEFSLSELNGLVKDTIRISFPQTYWLRAETSDVRVNASSGHCYLEFIEKDSTGNSIIAKARGSIWAKTFWKVKAYFEQTTGQSFTSGIKVMVKVSIEFHELYGYSLNVVDIDPTYTLGDMAKKRLEIIERLKAEGVFTLNKELPFPTLPKRIAVITSPTAAGYEDFLNQLHNNKGGYAFSVKLFHSIMQGDRTESSIITALEQVYDEEDKFDVVAIIRGGGATSELSCFDSYMLAAHCAQFPLPLITGIGHERDESIVDMVANTRMKTPTAVAEFLIYKMDEAWEAISSLSDLLTKRVKDSISVEENLLKLLSSRLPDIAKQSIERWKATLEKVSEQLPILASGMIDRNRSALDKTSARIPLQASIVIQNDDRYLRMLMDTLKTKCSDFIREREKGMQMTEQFVKMSSPEYVLRRGYSLSFCDGEIIKSRNDVKVGKHITTKLSDGEFVSIVYRK
jgi:exodeoxyribonuclease VII large subunit